MSNWLLAIVTSILVLGPNLAGHGFAADDGSVMIKKRIDGALEVLSKRVGAKKIERVPNEPPMLVVDEEDISAIHLLKECRSAQAVPFLLQYIDVRFIVTQPFGIRPLKSIELAADDALKAIGLPAIDGILGSVAKGSLEQSKHKPARALCAEVLGEEGLRARVGFLKLSGDERVKKFFLSK